MKRSKKLIISILIFITSIVIFMFLESGFPIEKIDVLIKPSIFSVATVIAFRTNLRKYLLIIALLLLIIMVFFYSLWQISLSDWFGSTGLGLIVIYALSLTPQLIKKGFVEKF